MADKIVITMIPDPEFAEPGNQTGLTEDGYLQIAGALDQFGDDVNIAAADDE